MKRDYEGLGIKGVSIKGRTSDEDYGRKDIDTGAFGGDTWKDGDSNWG